MTLDLGEWDAHVAAMTEGDYTLEPLNWAPETQIILDANEVELGDDESRAFVYFANHAKAMSDRVRELEAANEKLESITKISAAFSDCCVVGYKTIKKLEAEVERLRARLAPFETYIPDLDVRATDVSSDDCDVSGPPVGSQALVIEDD